MRGLVVWVVSGGTVVYLGVNGGGYDTTVWGGVGVIVWWLAALAAIVALDLVRRPSPLGWLAIGTLGGFAVWSAIGMIWSASDERTLNEVGRVALYLGVLLVAIGATRREYGRQLIGGIATGIVVISLIALLSRLRPTWLPTAASQTAALLPDVRNRLSYPLDYWNALGALVAFGIPLVLSAAAEARSSWRRAIAAAALPALVLTLILTLSRGAVLAASVALLAYLVLSPRRLRALASGAVGGVGAAIVSIVTLHDRALSHGLSTARAHHQGGTVLLVLVGVSIGVAAVQFGLALAQRKVRVDLRRPAIPVRPRLTIAALAVVLVAGFFAVGGPHEVSKAWHSFKRLPPAQRNTYANRLGNISGNGRYQMWRTSLQAFERHPITGIGAGTWEFWWVRHGSPSVGYAQNAHSLVFESLADDGIPGGILIVGFLVAIIFATTGRGRRAATDARAPFVAAAAACFAAIVSLATDWSWQVAVVPVCMMAVAGLALGDDERALGVAPSPRAVRATARLGIVALAAAALVSIVIPLSMTSEIRQSQAAFARGEVATALADARSATNLEPYAATPWLQQALVLEAAGDLAAAQQAALRAERNEPMNWTVPLILARIEAQRGEVAASLSSAHRELTLNPGVASSYGP